MASGRNARDNEIIKFRLATDAVNGINEIDVSKRLANHRTICLRWFLFHSNMDLCIPHV